MNYFLVPDERTAPGPEYKSWAEDELPLDFKLQMVRRHGSETLSYAAAVQTGLCHFANRFGFLAYQRKYGHTFVLGNPVVAPNQTSTIIDEFLKQHRNVTFCQVDDRVASILNERKYWVNELGYDSRIDLEDYNFAGKEKERFRYASNWLRRRKYEIRELDFDAEVIREVKQISDSWMKTRNVSKETAFMNRPLEFTDQPDVRRFFLLDAEQKIQAFVFFDPIFSNGDVIGYVTAFKRRLQKAPSLAEQGICKFAIDQFKSEEKRLLRLGLSPFADLADQRFRHNWLLQKAFRYYFNARWVNRHFFNLQGHAEFKNRFRGVKEKTYFASPSWINDVRLFAMMRLCKLI
jgi:phosphatidylglycerol lysyltransferase